jgi:hypothetical protein
MSPAWRAGVARCDGRAGQGRRAGGACDDETVNAAAGREVALDSRRTVDEDAVPASTGCCPETRAPVTRAALHHRWDGQVEQRQPTARVGSANTTRPPELGHPSAGPRFLPWAS